MGSMSESYITTFCVSPPISANQKKVYKCPMGKFLVPDTSFKDITINFTDMGVEDRIKVYRYLLVMVDRFTKWVKSNSCKREDTKTVI